MFVPNTCHNQHFYHHLGFDIPRILKTLFTNIKSGKILAGASSISQQYVKNLYLTFDQTWERKIEEARKYETTLQVVEATQDRTITETDVLSSAIESTEETTRTGTINQQIQAIRAIQREQSQDKSVQDVTK